MSLFSPIRSNSVDNPDSALRRAAGENEHVQPYLYKVQKRDLFQHQGAPAQARRVVRDDDIRVCSNRAAHGKLTDSVEEKELDNGRST